MKKLNLFVIITAFVTLALVGMASAKDDGNWGAIKGTYEMIATGSCLHSPTTGFSGTGTVANPFIPNGPTVFAAPTLARATWIFDGSGTATFVGENFATISPGGVNQGALERENPIGQPNSFHFDYTVDGHGWIMGTVREVPAIVEGNLANLTLEGRISKDHKIVTLSNGGQIQYPGTPMTAICNSARILFKVDD